MMVGEVGQDQLVVGTRFIRGFGIMAIDWDEDGRGGGGGRRMKKIFGMRVYG